MQNVLRIFFYPLETSYEQRLARRPEKNEKDVYLCLYQKDPFPAFFEQFGADIKNMFRSGAEKHFMESLSIFDEVKIQKEKHRLSLKDESTIIHNIYEANILTLENYLKKAVKDDAIFSLIRT